MEVCIFRKKNRCVNCHTKLIEVATLADLHKLTFVFSIFCIHNINLYKFSSGLLKKFNLWKGMKNKVILAALLLLPSMAVCCVKARMQPPAAFLFSFL